MDEEQTTVAVRRYLAELAGDSPSEPVIRASWVGRFAGYTSFAATLLYRSYPRLARPPLNLQADEMLGAVVEPSSRRCARPAPASVREFYALACQHMRWELNDLARRLDEQPAAAELAEEYVPRRHRRTRA